ncbi:unnamed protein product, partial [Ectocarpus sp. 12 AP-2014]
SYNSAIHACGRGGQWELALSLLKEMRELGLSPDRISFGAMVRRAAPKCCEPRVATAKYTK